MDPKILFETSPWFILLCILAGFFYAALLYRRKNPWGKKASLFLGFIRFITVSVLAFLLLGPLVRQIQNKVLEPAIVIVVDDSRSIAASYSETELENLNSQINRFITDLKGYDYQVNVEDLQGDTVYSLTNRTYDQPVTNLSKTLNDIENKYEGKNLQSVVLISDGIYNRGISPAYTNYSFPIYTLGIGDTVDKKDIILKSLLYNKIVYQGNRFPIVAEIMNNGFLGKNIAVDILQNRKIIETRTLTLSGILGFDRVEFELDAGTSGLQRYVIAIRPEEGEFSTVNNTQEAYVEIVEGKEKILLLASSPHPDIKALRSAIEKNENYELKIVIPGLYEYQAEKYDLVILHQLPDRNNNFNDLLESLVKDNIPVFYIIGERTHIPRINDLNRSLNLRPLRNQFDNTFPAYNPNFSLFNVADETVKIISDLPPVSVPFGEYSLNAEVEVILYQRVGNIVTGKPLLMINKNQSTREALLSGTGIWQWRLNEFKENQSFEGFDDLISKVVQYLSAKEDKRKFRVYPLRNEFWDNEPVVFETEIYNDIYEKIYGQKIDLTITDENDSALSYSYVTSPGNTRFRIGGLNPGVYQYSSISAVNGENKKVTGMFSVQKMQMESTTLTANHQLLKEISRRSGGKFFEGNQLDNLNDELAKRDTVSMIVSSENFLAIINMKWIFFIILALFTLEWGFRKYLGGY